MRSSEFSVPQCEWTGIVCNEDNQVTQIRWEHRDYTGTIPTEIRILSTLTHLDLSNNHLEGPIPEDLYRLTDLEKLYLFKNALTGTISTRIGDLDKITHFHVSHNYLTGPIPEELKSDSGAEDGIRPLSTYSMALLLSNDRREFIPHLNLLLV
jgi:Leucine-rich repeat (LRR) protein